jgi:hypothetical protein
LSETCAEDDVQPEKPDCPGNPTNGADWTVASGRSGCADGSGLPQFSMNTRLQTLGWGTWALMLVIIALVVLAVFLVTPAS